MKRLALVLACAAAAFVISGSAQAAPRYRVIQWDISHMCQVYDFGWGGRPIPSDYHILTPPMRSLGAALQAREALWHRGACLI
jgi:hypothetical protein